MTFFLVHSSFIKKARKVPRFLGLIDLGLGPGWFWGILEVVVEPGAEAVRQVGLGFGQGKGVAFAGV